MQDEETGAWYQRKNRDFKVALLASGLEGNNIMGVGKDVNIGADSICCHSMYFSHSIYSLENDGKDV